jgi:S1-C subfamily serine protease
MLQVEMGRWSTVIVAAVVAALGAAAPTLVAANETDIAGSTVTITRLTDGHIGAGVQIRQGIILTAAHLVAEDKQVTVKDDRGRAQIGIVRATDPNVDLAIVDVTNTALLAISPLSCETPPIGLPVKMIGHPYGREFVQMGGHVVSGLRTVSQWPELVLLDRRAFPGMSGGPVLSGKGDVVAMVVAATGRRGRFSGPAGAVPGSVICKFLPRAAAILPDATVEATPIAGAPLEAQPTAAE